MSKGSRNRTSNLPQYRANFDQIRWTTPCPHCHARGFDPAGSCPWCEGTGTQPPSHDPNVDTPENP